MKKSEYDEILLKLQNQKSILESQGYTVARICLTGSQNYNLQVHTDEYQSDVDMKAIIVPTLDDLIHNSKPISTSIDTEWGLCDLKDIRTYFETLLKANPAYIESLFTQYYIVDNKFNSEFEQIDLLKDELVYTLRAQMIRAMYGMMLEKEKAMCHPYPKIAHKIEKYKYDGKQVHHAYRLWLMMQDYYQFNKPFNECLKPTDNVREFLIDIKLNKFSLVWAKPFIESVMKQAKQFRDDVLSQIDESKIDYSVKFKFEELSRLIIKNKIVDEIRDE